MEIKHQVNEFIISLMNLSESHYSYLINEGIDDWTLEESGYVSFEGTIEEKLSIGEQAYNQFGNKIYEVPGFYKGCVDRKDVPMFNTSKGIGIPIRNERLFVDGFKIRLEEGDTRYIYLSSNKYGGPKTNLGVHFPKRNFSKTDRIGITEGPKKADASTVLSDRTVLGLQSVNEIKYLEEIFKLEVAHIDLAFDQDMHTNKAVARSVAKAVRFASQKEKSVSMLVWNPRFKGYDDALKHNADIKSLTMSESKNYMEEVFIKNGLGYIDWTGGLTESIERREDEKAWGKVKSLPSLIVEPDKLKPEEIPEFCRDYSIKVSRNMQAPIDFFLMPLMALISCFIGTTMKVRPKVNDLWTVTVNLWCIIIGGPGSFKSPMLKKALGLFLKYEKVFKEKYDSDKLEYKKEETVLTTEMKSLEGILKRLYKEDIPDTLEINKIKDRIEIATNKLEQLAPARKRFILNEPTPEATVKSVSENPEGIAIVRDELPGLFQSLKRAGRENERSLYLEGWNGDNTYNSPRISRDDDYVEKLCITLCGGGQPDVIFEQIIKSIYSGAGNDGLFDRFQLMVFPSLEEEWIYQDEVIDSKYEERIQSILDNIFEHRMSGEDATWSFDGNAQNLFINWLGVINNKVRKLESEGKKYASHLTKYPKLVVSLSLVFEVCNRIYRGESLENKEIQTEHLSMAIRWAEILEQHLVKIYLSSANKQAEAASALYENILSGNIRNGETFRNINRRDLSRLTDKGIILSGFEILEMCNIARLIQNPNSKNTRSKVVEINPDIFKEQTDNAGNQFIVSNVSGVEEETHERRYQ
ncbi:MAG: YfjI family protein [Bacteriovoracaceae bacterium]|jgi:putative DNA primase/helicase|nr:YfjI family protein [Bacteriovoracaceae bacterium]